MTAPSTVKGQSKTYVFVVAMCCIWGAQILAMLIPGSPNTVSPLDQTFGILLYLALDWWINRRND